MSDPNNAAAPLILPISYYAPVCRCLEDASAREVRCAIMHPDFFLERRLKLPLTPGKPFTEDWKFTPLVKLDGPVEITISGGGLEKPANLRFSETIAKDKTITKMLSTKAPDKPSRIPRVAIIHYPMKEPTKAYLKRFGIDLTLEENSFH